MVREIVSFGGSSAQRLYDEVIRTSNYFLHNCKYFSIEVLKEEDPSYSEVARLMRQVAEIIKVVADSFDPMMGQKAVEYCDIMMFMGIAIEKRDAIQLSKWVRELERKPGV